MMPPLVRFTLAYGAGLWVGLVVLIPHALFWYAAIGAVVAVCLGGWRGILAATVLAGLLVGTAVADRERGWCVQRWKGGPQAAWLRLEDAPDGQGRAWARVVHAQSGCGGRIRARIEDGDAATLRSGATFIAVGTWLPPHTFRVPHVAPMPRTPGWRWRVRDALAHRLERLYGERAPVAEALVLGRRGDVPTTLREAFTHAGLAHLLAISGLHVGMLAGWMAIGCAALGARRTAGVWAAIGTWGYVAMLGFPAPATRAAGFVTLYCLARVRERHPPPGAVLAAAVLIVLLIEPRAVTAVGAWLSVAAVWGTGTAVRLARGRPGVLRLAAGSAGAVLATSPITAWVFGSVAPAGLVTNLVAVPLAGVAVPGVFASIILGPLPAGGAGLALGLLERIAVAGSGVPGGHVAGSAGWRFALPWIGVLVLAVTVLRFRGRHHVLVRRGLLCTALGAWGWVVLDAAGRRSAQGELTIHALDVGQGDAIAIRTPRGRWLLVDGGPRFQGSDAGRRVVVPFLRRRGVQALDALIVSHGDADHLGGAPAVLEAVPTRLVLEPGQPLGTALYTEFLGAVAAAGAEWRPARAGDTLRVDGVTLAVLHPAGDWVRRELRPNENSLVIHLSYRAFDLLLTGDVGWPAESVLVDRVGQVEVLKVGHHGSDGSSRARWLDAVRPRVGVISVGRRNRYGHPAPAVLDRLGEREIAVFRTDRQGTVTLRTNGQYFAVGSSTLLASTRRAWCHVRRWLRSKASSWSRSACTPGPRESSPISFTTWPSPGRSSPATSGGPD